MKKLWGTVPLKYVTKYHFAKTINCCNVYKTITDMWVKKIVPWISSTILTNYIKMLQEIWRLNELPWLQKVSFFKYSQNHYLFMYLVRT